MKKGFIRVVRKKNFAVERYIWEIKEKDSFEMRTRDEHWLARHGETTTLAIKRRL